MTLTTQERTDAQKKIETSMNFARANNLHVAIVFYNDLFTGGLTTKVGYFEQSPEASDYMRTVHDDLKNLDIQHEAYFDGWHCQEYSL